MKYLSQLFIFQVVYPETTNAISLRMMALGVIRKAYYVSIGPRPSEPLVILNQMIPNYMII